MTADQWLDLMHHSACTAIELCVGDDRHHIEYESTATVLYYSAFTLATSELGQTGLFLFSKVDISKVTGTW